MKQLLKKHFASLDELETSMGLLTKDFNKYKNIINGRVYYPSEYKEEHLIKLKKQFDKTFQLLLTCIDTHKLVTNLVAFKSESGAVDESVVRKTRNVEIELAKRKRTLTDMKETIDKEL